MEFTMVESLDDDAHDAREMERLGERLAGHRRSPYYDRINEVLERIDGLPQIEPRIVEAYMRMQYRTLDGLAPFAFDCAVCTAARVADCEWPEDNIELAESFGL